MTACRRRTPATLQRLRALDWRSQASPHATLMSTPRPHGAWSAGSSHSVPSPQSVSRNSRSPSARSTVPEGPSPSSSITLPPAGCASIIAAIKYCKASRSRDSGTVSVAAHVPASRKPYRAPPRSKKTSDHAPHYRASATRKLPVRAARRPDTPASTESFL